MKVFAEHILESTLEYRRKTLLQLGQSTELIGSAILMNPGSAKPIGKADIALVNSFYSKLNIDEKPNTPLWKEFNVDSTMIQLVKIFNGHYIKKHKELNGIIQLFNCYYYKNPDLEKAIDNYKPNSKYVFNEYAYLKDKPVYFGWGTEGKSGAFQEIAKHIFESYNLDLTPIYKPNFQENTFYHPGYINRSFKRNDKTKELLKSFHCLLNEK